MPFSGCSSHRFIVARTRVWDGMSLHVSRHGDYDTRVACRRRAVRRRVVVAMVLWRHGGRRRRLAAAVGLAVHDDR